MGNIRDRGREVACSTSNRQGSNYELLVCVWRTVSSHFTTPSSGGSPGPVQSEAPFIHSLPTDGFSRKFPPGLWCRRPTNPEVVTQNVFGTTIVRPELDQCRQIKFHINQCEQWNWVAFSVQNFVIWLPTTACTGLGSIRDMPSKHGTSNQCRVTVGPPSATLSQH